MKFSEGDQVLAKLPSSEEFEKAKIINVKGSKYKVQFKGGAEHTISEGDVKAQRTSRSQTRTRGKGAKSPSRNSPSRRSPARRSPARSPNQGRKLPVRSAKQAKISIARLELPKDNSSDTDRTEESESLQDEFIEPPVQSHLRELGRITRRSIRIMSGASKAEQEQKLLKLRNADRAVSLPVDRKAQYNAATLEGKDRGLSVQREEDLLKSKHYEAEAETVSEEIGKSKEKDVIGKPQEWGGWLGALSLIIGLPVCSIGLQLICSNNYCSIYSFRNPRYKDWKTYLNLNAFLLYAGFLCFVAIISVLPIGRIIDGQPSKSGRLKYRINGIWSLILSVAVFGGCTYQGYNISDFLIKKSLHLTVTGVIYGVLLAIFLYIKGGRMPVSNLNIYGSTNNVIYDYWSGREVNPRVGPLDIKLVLFRSAIISSILVNLAVIIKTVKEAESLDLNSLNLAAILAAFLQILYLADGIVFESTFITTFEIAYEGTGHMLAVGYLIYPYLSTVTARYILANKVHQPIYVLSLLVVIYFIGHTLYRASNTLKDEFRKNPFAPSLSHLETIPTKGGKRLIVSGLWGHVRHPNYLGDIVLHWSMAVLSFTYTDPLPYFLAAELTLSLIHRALRDNARCEKRYGYAWEQYCSRVKYMIIKGVF